MDSAFFLILLILAWQNLYFVISFRILMLCCRSSVFRLMTSDLWLLTYVSSILSFAFKAARPLLKLSAPIALPCFHREISLSESTEGGSSLMHCAPYAPYRIPCTLHLVHWTTDFSIDKYNSWGSFWRQSYSLCWSRSCKCSHIRWSAFSFPQN